MTRLVVVTVLLAVVAAATMLRNRRTVPGRSVRITARAGLSRHASLAVVEIDGRRLLVGASSNAVNVLAELDPHPVIELPASSDRLEVTTVGEGVALPASSAFTAGPAVVAATGSIVDRLRGMTVRTTPATRSARPQPPGLR